MALGALIGAYQEDESGGLRALLPLAGQTLIEFQARCLAAVGAAPLLVLVERVPVALNDAFERLRGEGIAVVAVSDGAEAASRFEAGTEVMLLADGIAPDMNDVGRLGDLTTSAGWGTSTAPRAMMLRSCSPFPTTTSIAASNGLMPATAGRDWRGSRPGWSVRRRR
jgi:hypothetical protein